MHAVQKLLKSTLLSTLGVSLLACSPLLNTDPVGGNTGQQANQGLKIEPTQTGHNLPVFATAVPRPSVLEPEPSESNPLTETPVAPVASPVASSKPQTNPNSSADPSIISPDSHALATVSGVVYEDTAVPVDGGFVRIKSLNASVPFEAETEIRAGVYVLEKVPLGVQMDLSVRKSGFTPRRQVIVASATAKDLGAKNTFDFGTYYGEGLVDLKTAISTRPEVESVQLTRDATGVSLDTDFTLHFSEPMDTDSVKNTFGVYSASSVLLSVDHSPGLSGLDEEELAHSFYGVAEDSNDGDTLGDMVGENGTIRQPLRPPTTLVWDHDAFEMSWNADNTECRFQFKPGHRLLSDHELARIPAYLISFKAGDGKLKDSEGQRRESDFFKFGSEAFQDYFYFEIPGENKRPYLESIKASSNEDEDDQGNEIRLVFSEPMVYYTDSGQVRGNMSGKDPEHDPLNPDNYWVSVEDGNERRWSKLDDALVTFASADEEHKTVILKSSETHFEKSDDVTIRLDENLLDPAGNEVDNDNDEFTDRAD